MSYTVRGEDFDSIRDAWEEVLPLCEADNCLSNSDLAAVVVGSLWRRTGAAAAVSA